MIKFILIEWPDVQNYFDIIGFRANSCLANDEIFLQFNTEIQSSAYFVNEEWLKSIEAKSE